MSKRQLQRIHKIYIDIVDIIDNSTTDDWDNISDLLDDCYKYLEAHMQKEKIRKYIRDLEDKNE